MTLPRSTDSETSAPGTSCRTLQGIAAMAIVGSCTHGLVAGRNRGELTVVSLDDIRGELGVHPTEDQGQVAQLAREQSREYFKEGVDFAFNATNTMQQTHRGWQDPFAEYNTHIEIVYLEPIFDMLLQQKTTRSNSVPKAVIRRLADKC